MSSHKYTSKTAEVRRSDAVIFHVLSSFSNFTPILAGKVDGWEATEETCAFKVQGIRVGLRMTERVPNRLIHLSGADGEAPFPFSFQVMLDGVEPELTHLQIVMDVELNMMMKMMLGGKLQAAVDGIAEQIAHAFNNAHI